MTLSTDIYVLDPVDPEEVFRFCQQLLTTYDDLNRLPEEQRSFDKQDQWGKQSRTRANEGNQGLPAWLMSHYRPDEPLYTEINYAMRHDDDCDEDCDYDHGIRVCWMSVDFDTAYGYRSERNGRHWGCGDLHAAMVGELGDWLTSQGIRWEWRNEFTGEVHQGRNGLEELGRAGAEAGHWFATQVVPAILTNAALNGGGEIDLSGIGKINVPGIPEN